MKRALGISFLSILIAAGSAVAQPYTITDVGNLGGTMSQANGIGSLGQIVGTSTNASNTVHAFLYSGGAMHDLGTFGGTQSTGTAINGSPQIAGYFYNNGYRAFLWTGSTTRA